MPKACVLGAGMVGSVIAADLAADEEFKVCIADARPASLDRAARRGGGRVRTIQADLSDPDVVRRHVGECDIVLGALASEIGFTALRAVIEAGKPYCDISFMSEDALELDELAKERGVTAVVDCGVAPGMSNLLAGHGVRQLDKTRNIEIYVGGLPRERRWPFDYKAGFAPRDVIEEYTRPSRIVEHGRIVVREALSESELIDFPGIGTLEAFNTDGLRSLATTLDVPFMKEKTLRYPGHIELMRVFRHTGLFSKQPMSVAGVKVAPLDVISALMFPQWTYEEGEEDLTIMRVIVDGRTDGRDERLIWDLLDRYDPATKATSMSRTTAFPCAILARMLLSGRIDQPGVNPPERLAGIDGLVEEVLDEHRRRGVEYVARREPLGSGC